MNSCIYDYPIFGLTKEPTFDDGQGILGLRPAFGVQDTSSFLEQLAVQGFISKPIFSVFVTNDFFYTPDTLS